jgi:hypothetical protein
MKACPDCLCKNKWYTGWSGLFVWFPFVAGYIITGVAWYYAYNYYTQYNSDEENKYALCEWNKKVLYILAVVCILPWVNTVFGSVLLTMLVQLNAVQIKLDNGDEDEDGTVCA